MKLYTIALPLDSLLLRGVSAGPCFCLLARRRKHALRHARPRNGLKAGPALTPRNNRLSSGRAMGRSTYPPVLANHSLEYGDFISEGPPVNIKYDLGYNRILGRWLIFVGLES